MKVWFISVLLLCTCKYVFALPKGEGYFKEYIEDTDFSGIFFAAHNEKVIYNMPYGLANREQKINFNANSVFHIGSITKQFIAAAIMKLSEQRKLRLNDTLPLYFKHVPADKRAITLHQLLTHSSGFSHSTGPVYELVNEQAFISRALKSPLLFKPSTQHRHSNIGFGLLALIVEKVSGQGYEEFVRGAILLPAGLSETGYRLIGRKEANLVINYVKTTNIVEQLFLLTPAYKALGHPLQHFYESLGKRWNVEGSLGYLSTISDIYQWYLTIRARKVLTSHSWSLILAEQQSASWHAGGVQYGYGWVADKAPNGEPRLFHKSISEETFAMLSYYPESDVYIFVVANYRDKQLKEVASAFNEAILETVKISNKSN
ncbi:serine hydrolase domain-containing protein [Pseudoalteromonas aurantia]|uniref:Beta-lactamase-related domain-containing protein n=1 Tax=Pseudoalteromonas aurantia TaxID=43654 RepID=A0A5S3V9A9_9GAMM|nr:serine hydrolase domain-containing protein [Pseudoalteromonas aurantia]TMO59830.1 hypothetical protein CWC18_14870 [Pseudoalteromonas aurantia]TMO67970.1 hypothetical protein CWC19_11660 [Pseudoalteromonas aurantia]TMO70976.1 hypothetical protein CWC20_18820 [Pseudoalteromonas aurantia]